MPASTPSALTGVSVNTRPAASAARNRGDTPMPSISPCSRFASAPSPVASKTENLTLDEPALRTSSGPRMRSLRSGVPRAGIPFPVADLRHVFAVRVDVALVLDQLFLQPRAHLGCLRRETRHAIDHVADEMKAIEVVQHDHVERGRRR